MAAERDSQRPVDIHDDVLLLLSTFRMPLLTLPVTSVALRTSRGVVLIAPGSNIKDFENQLSAFGRVTDLIAPNLFHHVNLHRAQKAYPQAMIWGVDGFKRKRPDLPWDRILTEQTWTYGDEIEIVAIQGSPLVNECVFFHKESKTLVVTDLFFNLLTARGIGNFIILKLFGTYRRFGISHFYLKMIKDHDAFRSSLKRIAEFDFKTIIMSHGEPVTSKARETFEAALNERGLL